MRISDWSSDVCSSDLTGAQFSVLPPQNTTGNFTKIVQRIPVRIAVSAGPETRKLLVPGMSVEVSVDTRSARNAAAQIRREQERHNARIGDRKSTRLNSSH